MKTKHWSQFKPTKHKIVVTELDDDETKFLSRSWLSK